MKNKNYITKGVSKIFVLNLFKWCVLITIVQYSIVASNKHAYIIIKPATVGLVLVHFYNGGIPRQKIRTIVCTINMSAWVQTF